jgi:hypothetical protein
MKNIPKPSIGLAMKVATALVVSLALSFLAYNLSRNLHEISQYSWRLNCASLFSSFIIYSVSLALAIMCWNSVMHRLGGHPSLRKNMRLYCYTNLAKRLPTPVWYVAARVYMYDKERIAKRVTSTAILIEIVVVIFSGILVYLVSLPFSSHTLLLEGNIWVLLLLVPLAAIVACPSWLSASLNFLLTKFRRDKLLITIMPGDMLQWSALSSLAWTLGGFIIYSLSNGIYYLPLARIPDMVNIWAISGIAGQVALFMPMGMGVKELTLAYLLSSYMPLPVAVVVSLLSRLCLLVSDFFWALVLSKL